MTLTPPRFEPSPHVDRLLHAIAVASEAAQAASTAEADSEAGGPNGVDLEAVVPRMDRILAGLADGASRPAPLSGTPAPPPIGASAQRRAPSPMTLVGALRIVAEGGSLRSSGVSAKVARMADDAMAEVRAARHRRLGAPPRGLAAAAALADFGETQDSADTPFTLAALDDLATAFQAGDTKLASSPVWNGRTDEQRTAIVAACRCAFLRPRPI